MSQDEMRIALATWYGKTPGEYYCSACRGCVPISEVTGGGYHHGCGGVCDRNLPAYHEDLNLIHEAEAALSHLQLANYFQELMCVVIGRPSPNYVWLKSILPSSKLAIIATAPQRLEALVRTLNLWKD